jgi:hypothetical protein
MSDFVRQISLAKPLPSSGGVLGFDHFPFTLV